MNESPWQQLDFELAVEPALEVRAEPDGRGGWHIRVRARDGQHGPDADGLAGVGSAVRGARRLHRVIEVGKVAPDERLAFVNAFGAAFSHVFKPELIDELLQLFDADVYRPFAARADGQIVGTALDMHLDLTVVEGVTVPCRGITWVSALPTHRRRGVMRALLAEHEAECLRQGAVGLAAAQLAVRALLGLRGRDASRAGDGVDAARRVRRPAARDRAAPGRSGGVARGLPGRLGALPADHAGLHDASRSGDLLRARRTSRASACSPATTATRCTRSTAGGRDRARSSRSRCRS